MKVFINEIKQVKLHVIANPNSSIYDISNATKVKIETIRQMISSGMLRVTPKKGKEVLEINEISDKQRKELLIKYLKQNPGIYKFKIPIDLAGFDIDIGFVDRMIKNGEIKEVDGKVSVDEMKELMIKFEKVRNYLGVINPNATKPQISIHTGISIDDIDKMFEKELLIEDRGMIKEFTESEKRKMKRRGEREEFAKKLKSQGEGDPARMDKIQERSEELFRKNPTINNNRNIGR